MINTDHCWLYAGYIDDQGYGRIFVKSRSHMAHRVVYESFVGLIPESLVIDHLCRVRCCVNPSHLETVTLRENTLRGEGVKAQLRKTHCPLSHEYNEENTRRGTRGERVCRKCEKLRHARYYSKNKDKWLAYNSK